MGGKGASGRNAAVADRIEEHGLHVWFGFYDNAFRLMRDAYEELGRAPGEPLATLEDAFKPCDQIVLLDRQDGAWHPLQLDCPRNLLRPGEAAELPTFWEMAASASRWALDGWRLVRDQHDEVSPEPDERSDLIPDWFENLARDVAQEVLELPLDVAERLLSVAERLASERARHTDNLAPRQAAQPLLLVRLLKAVRDWLWIVLGDLCERNPDLRFFFTTVDAGVAMAAGIVEDGVLEHGFDRDQRRGVVGLARPPRRQARDDRAEPRGACAGAALRLRRGVRLSRGRHRGRPTAPPAPRRATC